MKTAPHPSLPFSLYFDEDAHRYLVDTEKSIEYWQPLPSVTQFVGHYIPPFDAQKAAAKKARFSDKTAEQILAEWDAKRIADGWLTVQEIADKWNCSYMKALDILVTSHAEWKWEDGKPYQGRKLWKIPETLSRQPTVHKVPARISAKKDWIDSLPKIDGAQIKEMVLDERKWHGMVGRRVAVEMKQSGEKFEAVLLRYLMCWFEVRRDNGRVETYKHREAKVVEEAK